MKEKYTAPKSEVSEFSTTDIVTTSSGSGSGPIELPDL